LAATVNSLAGEINAEQRLMRKLAAPPDPPALLLDPPNEWGRDIRTGDRK
jgi:hypothetical protein